MAGELYCAQYHKCLAAVKYLQEEHPEVVPSECLPFFQTQWEEYMKRTANKLKGQFY